MSITSNHQVIKNVHKTPFPRTSVQRHYANLQAKFGGNTSMSYWANAHCMWDVSERSQM
jgi:hypothetical protein